MQRMIFIALQRRQVVKICRQAHIVLVAVAIPVDAQPMQPLYFFQYTRRAVIPSSPGAYK